MTPCRIVDTRGPAGTFGGPSLPASVSRDFPLPAGPCAGIPASVSAYSLNITVTNTQGPGFILIYPQGSAQPLVSTLNYLAGQTLANAAIVPAGTSGGVTVIAGVSGTDLIIDINGYYSSSPANQANYFRIFNNSLIESILTINSSTSCYGACGIEGDILSTSGGYAVAGYAKGASGANVGVYGETSSVSYNSAGVRGIDGSGPPAGSTGFNIPAGLRGESKSYIGVFGISQSTGVYGQRVSSFGDVLSAGLLGTTQGVFYFNGLAGTGTKSFVEPHPTDATKLIKYVSIEGPEAGVYFRGRGGGGLEHSSHADRRNGQRGRDADRLEPYCD
jgi:hypothetical protein